MAKIEIRVSDLTGQKITDNDEVVRLVVEYHPDYEEPITLEARPEEVDIDTIAAKDFVVLSYYPPGQRDPQPLFVHLDDFNDLFSNEQLTPDQALQRAQQSQQEEERSKRRGTRKRGGSRQQESQTRRRERIDYSQPEYAGMPHRGTISDTEKEYVRNNLDEVNRRRREQGHDDLDPADPRTAARYGFPLTINDDTPERADEPIEEAEVIEERPPER
jgi:hypothetical protein